MSSDKEQSGKALVLRCCRHDMTSFGGFPWPKSGPVSCPDWDPEPKCGNGLHGWLWGEGELDYCDYWDWPSSVWLVVAVDPSDVVDMNLKVKFPKGDVVFCGAREDAGTYIAANGGAGMRVAFASVDAGDRGVAVVGQYGRATSGVYGLSVAGFKGSARAGRYGRAVADAYGDAEAGDFGHASAGSNGVASAGERGTALVGSAGVARAGAGGKIVVSWYDGLRHPRLLVGYVGEDGIEPDVFYKANDGGVLVPA